MKEKLIRIKGGCHCNRVAFEFFSPISVTALRCNCSICQMSGYLHLLVSHQHFRLISNKESLLDYRFGTGQAAHLFCCYCGIKSFYQPRSHPEAYSVNLNCIDRNLFKHIEIQDFDGQNWEQSIKQLS